MSIDITNACRLFAEQYGSQPELAARAPGRVTIIGEHTDYNHGFVLPMAIERETVILARRIVGRQLRLHAANFGKNAVVDLDAPVRDQQEPWADYATGVAFELAKQGLPLTGAEALIVGDVPIGSGLSSSASLEMAFLVMFETFGGFRMADTEAPLLGQRVENSFLGLSTGIMDQFVSRLAGKDRALFLDCRSLAYELVPIAFTSARFVIADTGVSRGLTASKYNERVSECRAAVAAMNTHLGRQDTHLRDFTTDDLIKSQNVMPEHVFRRARHIITENARTQRACAAMRSGDASLTGTLMDESDHSLRQDYEVTCPELDKMTAIGRAIPGCHGSRMTGAGFGGCTVHLVETDHAEQFEETMLSEYRKQTGLEAKLIVSAPAEGAGLVPLG